MTDRFLTRDRAKNGGNWFTYVGNNPLRYLDPTGNVAVLWEKILGYVSPPAKCLWDIFKSIRGWFRDIMDSCKDINESRPKAVAAAIKAWSDPETSSVDAYADARRQQMQTAAQVGFKAVKLAMEATYDNNWIQVSGSVCIAEGIDSEIMEAAEEFCSKLEPKLDNFKSDIMDGDEGNEDKVYGGKPRVGIDHALTQ